jgi:pimeloyl-ACP methyl ester carboxylesterase
MPLSERVVDLAYGTRLEIAEFGDPTGWPILSFHGSPSCRLSLAFLDEAAGRRAIRVIAPDRWGIGLSPMAVRRRLVDWSDDVEGSRTHWASTTSVSWACRAEGLTASPALRGCPIASAGSPSSPARD